MSVGTSNAGVATAALMTEIPELAAAHALVEAYAAAVVEQMKRCQERTSQLSSVVLVDSVEGIDILASNAEELEAVFKKIDALKDDMDRVHSWIVALNKMVKTIDSPADVRERATSLLKSFGFAKSKSDEGSAMWNRVPKHMMVEGKTPSEAMQEIRQAVEAMISVSTS